MCRRFASALLLLLSFAVQAIAAEEPAPKPFLHPLFTDHMVLQRDASDPVWGWTSPGARVTVSINGQTATATAGDEGLWVAKLGPLSAGGPFELTVTGPETIKLTDVLVGDVWI